MARDDVDELAAVDGAADLTAAMLAGDELAEAELRYGALARVFAAGDNGQSMSVVSDRLDRLMEKITRLRALAGEKPAEDAKLGKVVPFDADRYRKSS